MSGGICPNSFVLGPLVSLNVQNIVLNCIFSDSLLFHCDVRDPSDN